MDKAIFIVIIFLNLLSCWAYLKESAFLKEQFLRRFVLYLGIGGVLMHTLFAALGLLGHDSGASSYSSWFTQLIAALIFFLLVSIYWQKYLLTTREVLESRQKSILYKIPLLGGIVFFTLLNKEDIVTAQLFLLFCKFALFFAVSIFSLIESKRNYLYYLLFYVIIISLQRFSIHSTLLNTIFFTGQAFLITWVIKDACDTKY